MSTGATAKRSIIVTNGPADSSRTLNPACGIAWHQPSWRGQRELGLCTDGGPDLHSHGPDLRSGRYHDMRGSSAWLRRFSTAAMAALGLALLPVGASAAPTTNKGNAPHSFRQTVPP